MIGEVFQFGRADEGEVGGIEEEDRPLAFQIGLGDFNEVPLLVRLGDEGLNGFSDNRHE